MLPMTAWGQTRSGSHVGSRSGLPETGQGSAIYECTPDANAATGRSARAVFDDATARGSQFSRVAPVHGAMPAVMMTVARPRACGGGQLAEGISTVAFPDANAARLPMWVRMVLVGCVVLVASGAGLFGYRYFTTPTTLTVAAGSVESEAIRYLTAIASRLASTNSPVRLKVIDTGSALEAAKEFSAGKVNL